MSLRQLKGWGRTHPDGLVVALIVLAGSLVWLPYALSTTFLYDDYAFVAHATFHIPAQDSRRPGSRVVAATMTDLFGHDPRAHYVAVVILAAVMAAAFYVTLRAFHVPLVAAALAAALCLVCPRADSLRLWWAATQLVTAIILACISLALAGRWVDGGRFARVAFGAGTVFMVAAVVTYEATAMVVLLLMALLPFSRNRLRSGAAFLVQGIVAAIAAVFMYRTADPFQVEQGTPMAGWPRRFADLAADGWQTMLVNQVHRVSALGVLLGLVLGLGAAGALLVRSRKIGHWPGIPARGIQLWASAVAVAGLLAGGFLAWMPYVPANSYYTPSTPSVGNRVNGVAQLFFLASAGVLLGAGLGRLRTSIVRTVAVIAPTVGLLVVMVATFASESGNHAADFVSAAHLREAILANVRSTVPAPRPGDTVVIAGYDRTYSAEVIPVFAAAWDFDGAVKLLYNDGSLRGLPLDPAARCIDSGLVNFGTDAAPIPYSTLRLVDVEQHIALTLASRADCQRVLPTLRAPV